MYELTRVVDTDERRTSVWVSDSITAKLRLDALSLMSAIAAGTERVDSPGVLTSRRYRHWTTRAARRCADIAEQQPGQSPPFVPEKPRGQESRALTLAADDDLLAGVNQPVEAAGAERLAASHRQLGIG